MPQLEDDLTLEEALEDGKSGQLVPSNGYVRAVFTDLTKEAVEKTFGKLILATLNDYKKVDERRQKNLDAHDGVSRRGETITIPIAKRDSNQQLAWLLTTIFVDPIITVSPLEAGFVQIIVMGQNQAPELTFVSTSEEARDLQDLVNFYLKNKIAFKKTCRTWVAEMLRDGNRPPLLKVLHDPRESYTRVPQIETGESYRDQEGNERTPITTPIAQIITDPVLRKVMDGEPTRIECVPGDQFFIPFPEFDVQSAPFVFQEFEETSASIKGKIADAIGGKRGYDFCLPAGQKPDQDDIDLVLSGLENLEKSKREPADGRIPLDPQKKHRMFELWFYMPFAEEDVSEVPVFRMVSMCATVHWPSRKFLNCYENPYWHGRRPYHVGYLQQRPFSFSGYCTTENVAPFQRLISQLFHLQVQNMVQSNVKVFLVKKTSSTYKFLNGKRLRPGMVIPFDEQGDVDAQPLGTAIQSMSAEIAFLSSESEKMSVVTQYDRGDIPNRTPAATIAAVENLAKMQPAMVLDQIRETISDAVKMFVQTLIQFSPLGITIPYEDQKKRAVLTKIIHFPRETLIDSFAFDVTATADDETSQAKLAKDMQLTQQLTNFNNETMQIGSAIWKPGVPPPLLQFGTKMILGKRRMTAELLRSAKLDPDEFMPTDDDINQLAMLLLQMAEAAQQMQQQPPPPKVVLSGKLTPEQEAAAAQSVGFGGQNANVQSPGAGGAVPGPGGVGGGA